MKYQAEIDDLVKRALEAGDKEAVHLTQAALNLAKLSHIITSNN